MQDVLEAEPIESAIEQADVAVAHAVAPYRHSAPVRAIGWLSEAGDQPQMRVLCGAAIAAGLLLRKPQLARAGLRALLAHSLATWAKSWVKHRIDRTRPAVLARHGRYRMAPGHAEEKMLNSFPSGHTAGAVAVARALARDLPEHRRQGYAGAAFIALAQVPRCAHYPSDIAAGSVVGLVSEALVSRLFDRLLPRAARA